MLVLASLLNLPAEDWSALAAWCAVLLGVVAGLIALFQLLHARGLRDEQAQPYVVVYIEEARLGSWVLDLVIRNMGATAATDIRLEVTPPPVRAIDRGEEPGLVIPDLPVLVPGQDWRTIWDSTIDRYKSDLPSRYVAKVRYRDSRGRRSFEYDYVLDWDALMTGERITSYETHHVAEALREIRKILKRWSEASSVAVTVRDGDAADTRSRARAADRRAARDAAPADGSEGSTAEG